MDILLKISKVIRYKRIGIVVVSRKKSGSTILSYYQMQKKGTSVDVCMSKEDIKSFDEIDCKSLNIPTIICIHGIGLVQRLIRGNFDDIKQNIPNINIDEYIVELDETEQDEKLVALFRKEQIERILEDNILQKVPIHSISLGFIELSKYLQFFSDEVNAFSFEGNTFYAKERKIFDIRKAENSDADEYFFAGKRRKASETLALASGLTYFTERTWNILQIQLIKEKIKEYTAERLSSIVLYYLGPALLILLVGNLLLFNHYSTNLEKLEIDSGGIAMVKNEVDQIKADLAAKQQFVQQNNISKNFAFAFYTDRLSSYVPEGVVFSELAICPINKKVKKNETIELQNNTLRIVGTADNSNLFSIFLERINGSKWVSKVEKQIFNYNSENHNADFELEILLKDAIE